MVARVTFITARRPMARHHPWMEIRRPEGAPGDIRAIDGTKLCLCPDDVRSLRAAATRTGRSEAELLHEALEAYLASLGEPPLPGWIGAWTPP